jgi:DNA-binding NarL/FixJ family response regulator
MAENPKRQQPSDNTDPPAPLSRDGFAGEAHYRTYCGLPPRGRQVIDLFGEGLSIKQIAARLGSCTPTVRVQLANLRRKFGTESNQQLAILVTRTLTEKNRASKRND